MRMMWTCIATKLSEASVNGNLLWYLQNPLIFRNLGFWDEDNQYRPFKNMVTQIKEKFVAFSIFIIQNINTITFLKCVNKFRSP